MTDLRPWRRATSDLPTRAREVAGLLRLMVSRRRDRTTDIYEILSSHNNLGEHTLYLNMGYWNAASSYDEACEALAMLLAERAGLDDGQQVLDAGFGFADQDILWAKRFGVSITGLNITPSQVGVARERVAAAGLGDRIALRCRSALDTGLTDASVDRVMALESAFHFPSRDAFFAEALRVLRPGGGVALADICAARASSGRLVDRVTSFIAQASWQIPANNMYGADVYAERLRAAGFEDVRVEDISAQVFRPFGAYSKTRQAEADVAARANPLMRAIWRSPTNARVFDYVIVTARKPETSP